MKNLTWAAAFMTAILMLCGVVTAQEEQVPTSIQEGDRLIVQQTPSVNEIAQQLRQAFQLRQTIDQMMEMTIAGDSRLSLGYTCDSETSQCKCIGVIDCVDMVGSKHCGGTYVCGLFTCTCTWK
jgi:hypothetical protein